MDIYWIKNGPRIGHSMAETVAWAKANRMSFAASSIMLDMGDGGESIDVTNDVRDELAKLEDDAKSELQLLTEAVQQLTQALLRTQLEVSLRLEKIEAKLP